MPIDPEVKEQMKKQRLEEYERRMYAIEMDIAALESVGDDNGLDLSKQRLQALQKAYKAVEGM